jgi:hypothetical protein
MAARPLAGVERWFLRAVDLTNVVGVKPAPRS